MGIIQDKQIIDMEHTSLEPWFAICGMERLEKEAPTRELTDEQRGELAELSKVYEAKIADRVVFLNGEMEKAEAAGEFEQVEQLNKQLASERKVLEEELEQKKNGIRA